jgi:hypothetical protein
MKALFITRREELMPLFIPVLVHLAGLDSLQVLCCEPKEALDAIFKESVDYLFIDSQIQKKITKALIYSGEQKNLEVIIVELNFRKVSKEEILFPEFVPPEKTCFN